MDREYLEHACGGVPVWSAVAAFGGRGCGDVAVDGEGCGLVVVEEEGVGEEEAEELGVGRRGGACVVKYGCEAECVAGRVGVEEGGDGAEAEGVGDAGIGGEGVGEEGEGFGAAVGRFGRRVLVGVAERGFAARQLWECVLDGTDAFEDVVGGEDDGGERFALDVLSVGERETAHGVERSVRVGSVEGCEGVA